jgi:hypothetical protein
LLEQLKDVETKVTGLVETMPEEKSNSRAEEGARSVKEVFLQIAFANYLFPSFIGAKPPAGISPAMEKAPADKTKVSEDVVHAYSPGGHEACGRRSGQTNQVLRAGYAAVVDKKRLAVQL